MTDKQLFKLALDALQTLMIERGSIYEQAITALKERLAQPAQRTWVGLTDEDIGDAYVAWDDTNGASFADFARAIEAKLKQKNGYAEENT
jgi:predicted negative regulator of RcsB-dependent stress response